MVSLQLSYDLLMMCLTTFLQCAYDLPSAYDNLICLWRKPTYGFFVTFLRLSKDSSTEESLDYPTMCPQFSSNKYQVGLNVVT